jgi:hypothetical protein
MYFIDTTTLTNHVNFYCERTSFGFWSEPLNALTNLSFLIAAFAIAQLIKRNAGSLTFSSGFLVVCMAMIGVGSFLFHTFANQITFYLDVFPIFIYQLAFLAFYTKNVALQPLPVVFGIVLAFLGISQVLSNLPYDALNGSQTYASAFLLMLVIALYHLKYQKQASFMMLIATAIFFVSLIFRSIDIKVCATIPFGTHFVWHLLNGIVLYLTARVYILNNVSYLNFKAHNPLN